MSEVEQILVWYSHDFNLEKRALSAYYTKSTRETGGSPIIPRYPQCVTIREKDYVVVPGGPRGVLMVYRVKPDGLLKGLKRYPKEISEAFGEE